MHNSCCYVDDGYANNLRQPKDDVLSFIPYQKSYHTVPYYRLQSNHLTALRSFQGQFPIKKKKKK